MKPTGAVTETPGRGAGRMLSDMFRYKLWADRRTLDAVAALGQGECEPALAFARQQLNHMVRVEELFRARLLGQPEPHDATNSALVPGLEVLDQRITASNAWFTRLVAEMDASLLGAYVAFRFVDGKQGRLTREEILFHIVNHGTYHRGAIGHALDLAGAVRPADTYTVFIHAAEPGRRENV
jgi:uncharacterized damage-inducible protein DinB